MLFYFGCDFVFLLYNFYLPNAFYVCLYVFNVFLGLMIIEQGLELVKTGWKARRLNFGQLKTVTSHFMGTSRYREYSVMSRHPGTTRHAGTTRHGDREA